MMCPKCQANLGKINASGEPMIRNRGLILKAEGLVVMCPKCGGDVSLSRDMAKAMSDRILLLFRPPPKKA